MYTCVNTTNKTNRYFVLNYKLIISVGCRTLRLLYVLYVQYSDNWKSTFDYYVGSGSEDVVNINVYDPTFK